MKSKSNVTFSVDLDKDPDLIFQEIKLRIERELKRKGSTDKQAAFLSKLHEISNEHTDSSFRSTNDLIRALAEFASPKMKARIQDSSPTGRRKTISMNPELFDQISGLLAKPGANKAKIARQTGVSVVQVRKVAFGGYDGKFDDGSKQSGKKKPKLPAMAKVEKQSALPLSPPSPLPRPPLGKTRSVTRPPLRFPLK